MPPKFNLTQLNRAKDARDRQDFAAFMRRASPGNQYPVWLGPYIERLERAAVEPIRSVIAAPPRHTKTETTQHKLVQLMWLHPGLKVGVFSYNDTLATQLSSIARKIAERAGIQMGSRDALGYWELANGSSYSACGLNGTLTGKGFHIVVVDDPIKNMEQAVSPVYREKIATGFLADIFTRRQPASDRRTSYIVIATRWHEDDLSGRLIRQGWPSINMPARNPDGSALWPAGFSLEELTELEQQLGPYAFSALYMGSPRPMGDAVFGDPSYYDALPESGFRVSIGADFAYTSKTHSDFCSAVVLYHCNGISYVAEVFRDRTKIEEFRQVLLNLQQKHHGGKITCFVAHTEKGSVEMLNPPDRSAPIRAEAVPAVQDKFTRAQPAAAAWRSGKIKVPAQANWLNAFLTEVVAFTGVKDRNDDQVDALAGAFHPFTSRPPVRAVGLDRVLPF